jgi:hypothetical protein
MSWIPTGQVNPPGTKPSPNDQLVWPDSKPGEINPLGMDHSNPPPPILLCQFVIILSHSK